MKEEIRKTYYENGNIETERTFVDGVEHGSAKGWFESGQLEFEAFKENGLVQGLVKNYSHNGNLRLECNYVNQVKHGYEKLYYSDGALFSIVNYENGIPGDQEVQYTEEGDLRSEIEQKDSETEIIPPEIKKLNKGSKCTVFLTNSKEHLLVIFKSTYDEDYIDEVLGHTGAKDTIDGYDTIVNLTEDESVDLKEYPPVLIKCSSQSVLNNLHHYMPEKKFVLVYSWDLPEKHDVGEYDDYLDSLWDSSQQDETSEYANNDGKVEVVNKLLIVYVTDENVTENEPGLQIINFPSSSKSMQFASECGCGHNFEYDDLIVFEKEVFDNLEIKKVDGQIEWEGDYFPIAPILNLEVEKYKSKVILKH